MWRKSRQSTLGIQHSIGNPILIDTTYDGDSLDALPYVNEVPSPHSPRDPIVSQTSNASQIYTAMLDKKDKRISEVPTASSIYTRQSTIYDDDLVAENSVPPLFSDPTDKGFNVTQPASAKSAQQRRLSAIPVRKQVPSNTTAPKSFAQRAQQAGVTKLRAPWKGASGRSAQLTPITDRTSFLTRSTPTSGTPTSQPISATVSPLNAEDEVGNFTWSKQDIDKGMSPSSPQISTPSDRERTTPPMRPLRPDQGDSYAFSSDTPTKDEMPYPTPQSLSRKSQDHPTQRLYSPGDLSSEDEADYEFESSLDERGHSPRQVNSSDLVSASVSTTTPAVYDSSPPIPQTVPEDPIPVSRFSWTTRAAESEIPATPETRPSLDSWSPTSPPQVTPGQEPRSRFSWTTRNTESPPEARIRELRKRFSWTTRQTISPEMQPSQNVANRALDHPLDSHSSYQWAMQNRRAEEPQQLTAEPEFPLIARTRPLAPGTPKIIKRKPTPSLMDTPRSDKDKELPLSPPELDSIDLITSLEAQLEGLRHRRINLEKVIENLTALQPQNPVVQDLAARRENTRQIEATKSDLADVRNKEHETGLRLHRAWKRRDQEQPTSLWVRRVTGPK